MDERTDEDLACIMENYWRRQMGDVNKREIVLGVCIERCRESESERYNVRVLAVLKQRLENVRSKRAKGKKKTE